MADMALKHTRPTPGGLLDRHPLITPALCFCVAWLPYVIIFARSAISFGDLGQPVPFPTALYWFLLALQLFVCVISHSLAVRTIIGLYAPLWLIIGSIAFFCLSPMWGMLTAADVRHPLFAMMICVLTSATAFIVFTPHPKPWLWIELGLASLMVCLLRSTGIYSVLPVLICLLIFQIMRDRKDKMKKAPLPSTRSRLRLGAGTAAMISVLVVVCGSFTAASFLGWAEPLGEPTYAGTLVGQDVSLAYIKDTALNSALATSAADALVAFQQLPIMRITFAYPFYVAFFLAFLLVALYRRDSRALIVSLPQAAIFALSLIDPAYRELLFIIPALAAQIMFFGAFLKGTSVIGRPSRTKTVANKA